MFLSRLTRLLPHNFYAPLLAYLVVACNALFLPASEAQVEHPPALADAALQAKGVAASELSSATAPKNGLKSSDALAKKPLPGGPLWTELTTAQQSALSPLQGRWVRLSEIQKKKWIEISKNFHRLSPYEQTKLHDRMTDWSRLTPQERAQARLNFAAAKQLSPQEKQQQWEAYQALGPEEKDKLKAKAKAAIPNSAALAVKPQNKNLPIIPSHTKTGTSSAIGISPGQSTLSNAATSP